MDREIGSVLEEMQWKKEKVRKKTLTKMERGRSIRSREETKEKVRAQRNRREKEERLRDNHIGRKREILCVCVCVCVCERERERDYVCGRKNMKETIVTGKEGSKQERKRERKRA